MDLGERTVPERKTRGAVTVVEALREDILTLALQPGTAIDEMGLAKRFGLSRTPVREALLVLAEEGLVSFQQNRTSIVAPHSMHNANDYLDTLSLLSRAVCRQAAERRRKSDLDEIAANLEALRTAVPGLDVDRIEAAELALQRNVCNSTRNFFYQKYYPSCLNSGRRMLRLHYYPFATEADFREIVAEYEKLGAEIERQDAEQCDAIVQRIIMHKVEAMRRSIMPSDAATMKMEPLIDAPMAGLHR